MSTGLRIFLLIISTSTIIIFGTIYCSQSWMKSDLNYTFKMRAYFSVLISYFLIITFLWQLSSIPQWLLRFLFLYDWLFLLCCAMSHTQSLWPALWSINSDLQDTNRFEPLLRKRQSMLQCSLFNSPLPLKAIGKDRGSKKIDTECKRGLKERKGRVTEKKRIRCKRAQTEDKWRRSKKSSGLESIFIPTFFFFFVTNLWPKVKFHGIKCLSWKSLRL